MAGRQHSGPWFRHWNSLEPRPASSDPIERLIDDLTEAGARKHASVDDPMDMMDNLVVLGFDCVPTLLAHVEDVA